MGVDALRIRFALRALADVAPWGDGTRGKTLHWFGLTDGWYDVLVGEHRLFAPEGCAAHGIDYPVVRIWEDLVEVAPYALEELPAALTDRTAVGDAWDAWVARAWKAHDNAGALTETALAWWPHHHVDSGHLVGAPQLDLWRRGDALNIRWRSQCEPDGPTWSSPRGDAVVDAADFREELIRFDRAMLEEMQTRIDAIGDGWDRPDIAIDLDELRREHADRESWLATSLESKAGGRPPWDDVVAAVIELEHLLGSSVLDGN